MDKSLTNALYEIEIDPQTQLPITIKMLLLAATKGETEVNKAKKIVGGRHVAFHFRYDLSDFGKVEKPKIPQEAQRLLAKG
ncbi:MAG: hypothetical protein HY721_34790 [Planctomycetes bacterium]|nr:hypothetical protein [Planctomycetota bacterium]